MFMPAFFVKFDVFTECRESRLGFWECPPFLFVMMGVVNIITVIAVYLFAQGFVEDPRVAALIVIFISAMIFLIGNLLITGFNKIAEANRIKSEFLNIVSHQLRTPLSVFKWTTELIEAECAGFRHRSKYLPLINDHIERMVRIVNLLLDVSRIEAGRFTLQRGSVPLVKITEEAIRSMKPYADATQVKIIFIQKGELKIRGDIERLRMVIQNLIDNAIRYSSRAGTIAISVLSLGNHLAEWRIKDQGVGIPKGQQKYIFQKFFRATNGIQQQTQGTGLGLYIARAVVIELGGEIGFESGEEKGSTFWFRLPIYK